MTDAGRSDVLLNLALAALEELSVAGDAVASSALDVF